MWRKKLLNSTCMYVLCGVILGSVDGHGDRTLAVPKPRVDLPMWVFLLRSGIFCVMH